MSDIAEFLEPICTWAKSNSKIAQVFIIGSRAKGSNKISSDLDVAIRLHAEFGYRDWFYESDEWTKQLQAMIRPKVHLLRGGGSLPNKIVEAAIEEHGYLIYEATS